MTVELTEFPAQWALLFLLVTLVLAYGRLRSLYAAFLEERRHYIARRDEARTLEREYKSLQAAVASLENVPRAGCTTPPKPVKEEKTMSLESEILEAQMPCLIELNPDDQLIIRRAVADFCQAIYSGGDEQLAMPIYTALLGQLATHAEAEEDAVTLKALADIGRLAMLKQYSIDNIPQTVDDLARVCSAEVQTVYPTWTALLFIADAVRYRRGCRRLTGGIDVAKESVGQAG